MQAKSTVMDQIADRLEERRTEDELRADNRLAGYKAEFEPAYQELLEAEKSFTRLLPLGRNGLEGVKRLRLPSELGSKGQRIRTPYLELQRVVHFGSQQIEDAKIWFNDLTLDDFEVYGVDRIRRAFLSKLSAAKGLSDSIERLVVEIERASLDYVKANGVDAGDCLEVADGSIDTHIREIEARTPAEPDRPWYVD